MAYIPCDDPDVAIAEARAAAARGLRGAVLPHLPPGGDWAAEEWAPLWRTIVELGWPAHFHVGGSASIGAVVAESAARSSTVSSRASSTCRCRSARSCSPACFAEHPDLKLVCVEGQIGWIPFWKYYIDHVYEKHRWHQNVHLPELPSTYIERQMWFTFMEDPPGIEARHACGIDRIMWSNDYPHSETTWPHSQKIIGDIFERVPVEEVRKIVRDNCVELYGLVDGSPATGGHVLDYLIKGGTVVDGTGGEPYVADVGIRDGRIVEVGDVTDDARTVLDASGLLVTPGFIDPHTHYDAQLHWDGWATPSSLHGVTTVIAGNCGFTLAPLKARGRALHPAHDGAGRGDADRRAPAGAVVGVAQLRRVPRPPRRAGRGERRVPRRPLARSGATCSARRPWSARRPTTRSTRSSPCCRSHSTAGGLGLSLSRSYTHTDGDGRPVPSRLASEDEVLTLCDVVGRYDGTSLEAITDGCIRGFDDDSAELIAQMSARGRAARSTGTCCPSPPRWRPASRTSCVPRRGRGSSAGASSPSRCRWRVTAA